MSKTYIAFNGANPTTAALTAVTTGVAIKTLQQIDPGAGHTLRVIEWGISFAAASTPIQCELIQTDVAATVTAYAAADVMPHNDPNANTSLISLGTSASGFTASAEGTTTVTRVFDYQYVSQLYVKQFPLGREPEITGAKFLRVRVTSGTAVNAICYIIWEE